MIFFDSFILLRWGNFFTHCHTQTNCQIFLDSQIIIIEAGRVSKFRKLLEIYIKKVL
ncbi:hypothetical protein J2810_002592 [Chryseobacterium rhizosphaerae]|nr:hypothetical protein [Chryseobacterium rhizosphaerae]